MRKVEVEEAVERAAAAFDAGISMVTVTADTPGYPRILRAIDEVASGLLLLGVSSATTPEQVRAHVPVATTFGWCDTLTSTVQQYDTPSHSMLRPRHADPTADCAK